MKLVFTIAFALIASATAAVVCEVDYVAMAAAQQSCSNSDGGCLTSNGDSECLTAKPGYFLEADKVSDECATGCTACTDDTAATCTACATGYMLKTKAGSIGCAAAADAKCKTYALNSDGDGVECTAINDGFFGTAASGVFDLTAVNACDTGCTACTDATAATCTACSTGYILKTKAGSIGCAAKSGVTGCGTYALNSDGDGVECTACQAGAMSTASTPTYVQGYVQTGAALATAGKIVSGECILEVCANGATCTYTAATATTAATTTCPAPAGGGTAGTAGTAGTGPDTGTKAAAGTIQASLSVLLAGLALAMFARH